MGFKCFKQCIGLAILRNYSSYQYKYNSKLEELINRQIQAEQQASQDYLNIAVYFLYTPTFRPGAGGCFMAMYKEELDHMQDCINYQLMRGGLPLISGLKPPVQHKNLKLIDAFKLSLKMEKDITELLEETVSVANQLNDYQCADFITAAFLTEQMQAVQSISRHITRLTLLGDNEHAIYNYDLQLAKEFPYSEKNIPKK